MFELDGIEYSLQDLERAANKYGMDFNSYLQQMKSKGLVEKQEGLTVDSTIGQDDMRSQSVDGSLEQPEINAWQSFKNNISNAFEMGGDVLEFYGVGTGDKSVEEVAKEGDLGAYSGLNIASTLIYESVFGKDKMKEMAANNPNFFKNFYASDSKQFQDIIENFEIEKKDRKETMTFKQADSIGDYLSVVGGAIANVGGSVAYNLGTLGTGFFMDFASDNFITANKEKAKANDTTLEDLMKSGDHDVGAPFRIAAFQAGLEYVGFSKIMKPLKGTGVSKKMNKEVGNFLTKNYKKNKNIRVALGILSTGKTEALTEMGQTGLEIYNKELAVAKGKGEEINDLMSITKGMFSEEGIEAGLQGFFGGAGLKAGTYSAKTLTNVRKSSKDLDVEEDLNKLVSLKNRYNSSKDEDVRYALNEEIKKVESSIKSKVKKGNDVYSNLTDEEISKIEKLSDLSDATAARANNLIDKFRNKEISEDEFNIAINGLSNTYKKNKQSIQEILYKENIEFAKKEAEKIGKKIVEVESFEEFQKKYDEIRTEGDFEGDVSNMDGFIKGDEIYINKQTALKEGAISVGSHELLHGVIGKSFDKLSKEDKKKLGKSFIGFLNKEQEAAVRKRLKESYGLEGDAIFETEEIFTAFSDAITKEEITFNETVFQKIGLAIQELMNKLIPGYRKEFKNGRQAYDFLKEYQANVKEGKLGERVVAFAGQDKDIDVAKFKAKASKSNLQSMLDTLYEGNVRKMGRDAVSVDPDGNRLTKPDLTKSRLGQDIAPMVENITQRLYDPIIETRGLTRGEYKNALIGVASEIITTENFDPTKQALDKFVSSRLYLRANALATKLGVPKEFTQDIDNIKEPTTSDVDAAPTTKKTESKGQKARVLKSLADVSLDNKEIISATARAEIDALIEQNPKNLEEQITKLIEKEITKAVKAQMGKISNVKGEVVISDEYKAFIALNYENIVQSLDVNTIKNNYKTLFELTEIGKEDRKTRKSDKPSLKKDSNYRKGIFKIETNKAKFTKFFTEGGYTTLLARQKGLANQIAKGITEDVINNEIIENSNDVNAVIKAEVADYGNRLNKQKDEVVGNYADQIKFSKTAATKHALDQIFLVEEVSKKGYNKVFNNKGKLFSKYKNRKIDIDSIDFVNELHDKGLIIPSEAMSSIQSKAYSKALSLVIQKVGAKSRANTYEWVPINIALEIGGKYGLEMLTPKPAEGGLPDFHSALHGFDFFVEGKLLDAQHGSATIKEANLTTGKMEILNNYKFNPVLQEMWDSKIKELKDYASLVVDLMKEKGIKISELKNNTPIPAEIYMQAGRQMYNIQKNTTARKFMPGKAFDIVSELYNNKKLPDGTPVPNYYINILGKGLRWLGDNIYNLPVPKFEGDINMAMRAVAASSTPVKAPKGYEAFHKPGMKYYALNMRFIPTVDMKSVKGESKYSIDNKAEMIALLKTDAVLEMKRKREKINGSKFSKSVNKARTIDYSKSSKGITVLDFDDTLATTKSLVKYTRPDGTTGTLNAEEYASTYEDLQDQGFTFDFSDFNKVVKGKLAPLFQKALKLQGKFGPENMFVLTARPPQAAKAIFDFLKANGLNIPIKNITGLGNSTAEAKALWIADKVGDGFNDFYFADDALQNTQAVQNMLDQFDVKSKVQQAKVKFSKSMNDQFNDILENVTGIEAKKRFSAIKGRKRGESKGKFRFFIPPSHEDFVGLLYNFLGKGKKGNAHRDFFEKALIRPLNRANREYDTARQSIANDYKALGKRFPGAKKSLLKKTPDGDFTYQDAVRVYLWDKHGYTIPGLSPTDQIKLVELVNSTPGLRSYAENINIISRQETYVNPTEGWNSGDIRMDLDDATGRIGRQQFFAEFIENADIIFSEENLNKIEAGYGKGVRSSLEDMLYRIKTGRNRPSGQNKQVNNLMNYLNGSVGTVMFFNMRSALLQQMSLVNYINFADNNIFAAAKAFANQKQYWADWAFIFNSDMLRQRRGGIQTDVNGAELAASLRNSKDITRKLISKLLELGFLPTQIGDNIAIATGGATYYRNRINTYLKQGLSQKEAEAKAFDDFQAITQSTQQSARPDMVSKQQASVIGKVILNFQNVTSQFNRLGKKAFQDIYNRRITKPNTTQMQSDISNAARITYYFAVQNAIFYTLQTALFAMMFDDDEEDDNKLFLKKKERLINGSIDSVLRGSGLIGGVIATLKNVAIAFARQRDVDYNPDESAVGLEALNLSPVLGIKLRKIVNAEKTLNYNKKVIKEMETLDIDNPQWSAVTNYVEAFTNVPLNRLYNKTQNVRQALNNDHSAWERTLMFLGWSQYNLNLENKKMDEIKESVKSKKKKKKKKSLPKFN